MLQHCNVALLGGRGSGKSTALVEAVAQHVAIFGAAAKVLWLRRQHSENREAARELLKRLKEAVPGTTFNSNLAKFTLPNGASVDLDQLASDEDLDKFQGRSFTLAVVDETGNHPSPRLIDRLRANLRSPTVPCRLVLAGNPGGVGHQWLWKRYVQPARSREVFSDAEGELWIRFDETYRSNGHLSNDYETKLRAATGADPELQRAWLEGDWNIARGAFYGNVLHEGVWLDSDCWTPDALPREIQYGPRAGDVGPGWKLWLGFDWGMSAPSVAVMLARSPGCEGPDGRWYPKDSLIAVDEYHSADPDDLTRGLGFTVPEIAAQVRILAERWGVKPVGWSDPSMRARSGSQAGSLIDQFRREGIRFKPANSRNRVARFARMSSMFLAAGTDKPGLYISRRCTYLAETMPTLPRDKLRREDIDTKSADHGNDALSYSITGTAGSGVSINYC